MGQEEAGDRGVREARTGAGVLCPGEADRVEEDHGSERGWGGRETGPKWKSRAWGRLLGGTILGEGSSAGSLGR